jgi:hypothetical protein
MMKILGFGDSFILNIVPENDKWLSCYQGMISNHFNTIAEFRGIPGTGPWNMFFDWKNYVDKNIDICIFAWSEIVRLYHSYVVPICPATALHGQGVSKETPENHLRVINAAKEYYMYLMDHDQKNYELTALMHMVDEMTKEYPNTKFIHMPCFSKHDIKTHWAKEYPHQKPEEIEYFYRFKNGAEIRPALMYLSMKEEWPTNLAHDKRECHMSTRMNRLVADAIIECIEDYYPGKLVEMDLNRHK